MPSGRPDEDIGLGPADTYPGPGFLAPRERCAYLADRSARLEVNQLAHISPEEYDLLLSRGWRRMGSAVFRARCEGCQECIPIRIPISGFRRSKSQRRVWNRNADVELRIAEPSLDPARLELYDAFHRERARSRGWPENTPDPLEYLHTFVLNAARTLEFSYWLGPRLVGVAIVGESQAALNSIYAYFDPQLHRRSLGTFDVLSEIEEAARRGKDFLYLGYYVEGCISMRYKAGFRPHELRTRGAWAPPSPAGPETPPGAPRDHST
ncbi:MAG: arginyltransferase [Cyanothece sp. SIO1E1]|nr:arginyltransferase [Cyanothece sp. SIO1E1]